MKLSNFFQQGGKLHKLAESEDEVREKQLAMGIPIEAGEHHTSLTKGKTIAHQHLVEDKQYYTKLKKAGLQMGGYTPTNLQQASFVPTYVGTPLEDAQKYGTDLLNTYKTNIADLTKIDIANAQRRVIEGDTAESAKYDQELKAQFESMAQKGDYENMTSQVNELARRHVNNKQLKAMAENRAAVDAEDEMLLKMRAAGHNPVKEFLQDRKTFKSVSYDADGNPTHNVYKPRAEMQLDYQKAKADVWNVIKPSLHGMSAKEVQNTMRAIDGYITTGTWSGIADTTIKNQVENALIAYKGTSEYAQEFEVDVLKARQAGFEGQAAIDEAERLQKLKMESEGMLRVFEQVNPDYVKNWMQEKAMADKGNQPNNPFLPGSDLGTRIGTPDEHIVNMFDPDNVYTAPNGNAIKKTPWNALAAWSIQQQGGAENPEDRGTEEQRKQYMNIARRAVQWKNPGEDKFKQFYEGDPATGEAAEKKYLFSKEVHQSTKNFQEYLQKRMLFPVKQDYDFTVEEGKNMKKADDLNLRTNWQERRFLNLDTNEIVSPLAGDGKLNPNFSALISDPSKLEATGRTSAVNPYAFYSNDPDFADATFASYTDPKTNVSHRFLVALPPKQQNFLKGFASDLWMDGVSAPLTPITKNINFGNGEIAKLIYEDLDGQGIRIHSFNGEPINVVIPNDYEAFVGDILKIRNNAR